MASPQSPTAAQRTAPRIYNLPLPSIKSYSSFERGLRKIQQFAKENGFCLRKKTPSRYKTGSKALRCYTIVCDKMGECNNIGLARETALSAVGASFL